MTKCYEPSKHIKICCAQMSKKLEDFRFPIDMDMAARRYFIPYVWPHSGIYTVLYCPWCGTYLPTLEEKWDEMLEKEFGITSSNDPNIPEEFFSEEWWVKRGL